jgi:hypothetical protein
MGEKPAQDVDQNEAEKVAARELTDARRLGKSTANTGGQDLRDAETFRALREQEKPE